MHPRDRLTFRIQCRRKAVVVIRSIHIVLDVRFAIPDHLDGALYLLADPHGQGDIVDLQAPAECSAQVEVMDDDSFRRQADDLGGRRLNAR